MAALKYFNEVFFLSKTVRANISTSDQRCFNVVDQRWSNVGNQTKSDVGFSTLHNVDTTSVSNVEITSKQRCTPLVQCWYNFVST